MINTRKIRICLMVAKLRYNWFCNTKLYMYTYIALQSWESIFVQYKCVYSSLFDPPPLQHTQVRWMWIIIVGLTAQEAIFCGQDRPCWPGHKRWRKREVSSKIITLSGGKVYLLFVVVGKFLLTSTPEVMCSILWLGFMWLTSMPGNCTGKR